MDKLKKLLTDKLWLSALGVLAVFVVCVAYMYSGVLGLPLPLVQKGAATVTVDLTSTGGLYVGSPVNFRGVKVGKVQSISLGGPSGVEAKFILTETSLPVPAPDEKAAAPYARVRSLSPVGEQYLDLEPSRSGGPYLENGSVIKASVTDLPKTLGSTVVAVNKLLVQIDPNKLHGLLDTFATGLGGTGEDLGRSFDNMKGLLADLKKVQPQTISLIKNLGPTLDIVNANAGDLQSLATSANTWATYLDANKNDLITLLSQTPGNLQTIQGLINAWGEVLPTFFPTALKFGALTTQYNPSIRSLLQSYQPGLGALLYALHDGRLNLGLIAASDARCTSYGTTRHSPTTTGTTLQPNGHCSIPPRGERSAPAR